MRSQALLTQYHGREESVAYECNLRLYKPKICYFFIMKLWFCHINDDICPKVFTWVYVLFCCMKRQSIPSNNFAPNLENLTNSKYILKIGPLIAFWPTHLKWHGRERERESTSCVGVNERHFTLINVMDYTNFGSLKLVSASNILRITTSSTYII